MVLIFGIAFSEIEKVGITMILSPFPCCDGLAIEFQLIERVSLLTKHLPSVEVSESTVFIAAFWIVITFCSTFIVPNI